MPEYLTLLNSIIGGLSAAALMSAIAWFFTRKWMERVEATPEKLVASLAARLDEMLKDFKVRMDRLEQESRANTLCSMDRFRTKEESQAAWLAQNGRDEKQEAKLDDIFARLIQVETTCKVRHD